MFVIHFGFSMLLFHEYALYTSARDLMPAVGLLWHGNDVSRIAFLRYGRTAGGRDKGAKDTRYEAQA